MWKPKTIPSSHPLLLHRLSFILFHSQLLHLPFSKEHRRMGNGDCGQFIRLPLCWSFLFALFLCLSRCFPQTALFLTYFIWLWGLQGSFSDFFFFFSFIPHTSGQGFADIFIQTHKLGWGSQLLPAVTLLEPAVVVCVQHWAAPVTPHRHHPCSPPTPLPTLWQLNQIQLLSFVLTPSSYFMVK